MRDELTYIRRLKSTNGSVVNSSHLFAKETDGADIIRDACNIEELLLTFVYTQTHIMTRLGDASYCVCVRVYSGLVNL